MEALCAVLARAYDRAVDQSGKPGVEHHAWMFLAYWSDDDAAQLRRKFVVTEVAEDMPYPTAREMFADLDRGQFRVSCNNLEHPLAARLKIPTADLQAIIWVAVRGRAE